jgi:AcrR family transcriptional regulator
LRPAANSLVILIMAKPTRNSSSTRSALAAAPVRSRLSNSDRRTSIIAAAKTVFATSGYEGAKTLQIANAAGVSEALVYRHFVSKAALYRAVLRRVIQEQDENMADAGPLEASANGLIEVILRSVRWALLGQDAPNAEGMRLVFGSLGSDANYARLVYRRAKRLVLPQVTAAVEAATKAGDITVPIASENVVNFFEHIISMVQVMHSHDRPIVTYPGDHNAIVADVVRFCARGIGLREALVEDALAADRKRLS